VTIAVDSYGPVTDNAQSVYELSQIEEIKGIEKSVESEFGFRPLFEKAKRFLEENDGAGNTFKATAKPGADRHGGGGGDDDDLFDHRFA
jgi:K(+)-stimulated pyrophosphate-energized sodium pump